MPTLLLLSLLLATANAAVPLALPPSEPLEPWLEVLALGDLEPGQPGAGAFVILEGDGSHWHLRVRDSLGTERIVEVRQPVSLQDRENLVWLARSLLDPMEEAPPPPPVAPVVPVKPPFVPPSRRQTPSRPARAPEPIPAPLPEPPPAPLPEPSHTPEATPAPEPPPAPPPEPPRTPEPPSEALSPTPESAGIPRSHAISPYLGLGFGTEWRSDVGLPLVAGLCGGVTVGRGPRLGLEVGLRSQSSMEGLVEGREMTALDARAHLSWSPAWNRIPSLGIGAGAASRQYLLDGQVVQHGLVPIGETMLDIPFSLGLPLVPTLRLGLQVDLRRTEFLVNGEAGGHLPPLAFLASLDAFFPGQ